MNDKLAMICPNASANLSALAGWDFLARWVEAYFAHAVSTFFSQQEQRRDLARFLHYKRREETEARPRWSTRQARAFQDWLRLSIDPFGRCCWSDRTFNRTLAPSGSPGGKGHLSPNTIYAIWTNACVYAGFEGRPPLRPATPWAGTSSKPPATPPPCRAAQLLQLCLLPPIRLHRLCRAALHPHI